MCSTCENWRISGICVVLVTFSQQTKNRGTEPEAPPLIFRCTHDNKRGAAYPFLEFPHQRHDFAHNLSVLTGDGGERIVMGQ